MYEVFDEEEKIKSSIKSPEGILYVPGQRNTAGHVAPPKEVSQVEVHVVKGPKGDKGDAGRDGKEIGRAHV